MINLIGILPSSSLGQVSVEGPKFQQLLKPPLLATYQVLAAATSKPKQL
jgi:hypothetical protein